MKISRKIAFVLLFVSFSLPIKAMEYGQIEKAPETDVIFVKNLTNEDFWVKVKFGGQLKQSAAGHGLVRIPETGEAVLFSGKVPANSEITFNKKRFNNITMRFFKNETDFNKYENSFKSQLYIPATIAGFRGISLKKINPKNPFTNNNITQTDTYNFIGFICPICTDPIQKSEKVKILYPCGHFFHQNCIEEWINKSHNCPICRIKTTNYILREAQEVTSP